MARQLIRAVRGRRSQQALAKRLGARGSVVYSWEAGRRFPSASRFFATLDACGIDVAAALGRFLRVRPGWLERSRSVLLEGVVVDLLAELKGRRSLVDVARAMGKSRFRIARWFAGETEPRLPDFLELVHVTSYRVVDFVAACVDPERVPILAREWQRLEAARQAAYAAPWCHAVLRLLETQGWSGEASVTAGGIAAELGIDVAAARESLSLLETSGQIERSGAGFRVKDADNVDLAQDPAAVLRLKAWAAEVGLTRLRAGADGSFSYNLFCVSERDYRRLQELQRGYFRELRAFVAVSRPSERVVMTNLQLFALSSGPKGA